MVFSSPDLSKCSKNGYFLNVKIFFEKPAGDTAIEKIASVIFLIYAVLLDIANIAKKPFIRKVTIETNYKKYVGYALIAFACFAVYQFKKQFPNVPRSTDISIPDTTKETVTNITSHLSDPTPSPLTDSFENVLIAPSDSIKQSLSDLSKKFLDSTSNNRSTDSFENVLIAPSDSTKQSLSDLTKKLLDSTPNNSLTDNLKSALNSTAESTKQKLSNLINKVSDICEINETSEFFGVFSDYGNEFIFCGSALVIMLALYNFRSKTPKEEKINIAEDEINPLIDSISLDPDNNKTSSSGGNSQLSPEDDVSDLVSEGTGAFDGEPLDADVESEGSIYIDGGEVSALTENNLRRFQQSLKKNNSEDEFDNTGLAASERAPSESSLAPPIAASLPHWDVESGGSVEHIKEAETSELTASNLQLLQQSLEASNPKNKPNGATGARLSKVSSVSSAAPLLASSAVPSEVGSALPERNLLTRRFFSRKKEEEPEIIPHEILLEPLTKANLAEIEEVINFDQYKDYVFFWKTMAAKKNNPKWRRSPPIKYLDAKWQISGGSVFIIKGVPNFIFKIYRHSVFDMRGNRVEKDTKKDIKSGLLIDVEARLKNIEKCREIIEGEKIDSIVLPNSFEFDYTLEAKGENIKFPMMIQEKFDFVKDANNKPLTLYEALKEGKISDNSFEEFVRFLLISGFEDVRKDNILIIEKEDEFKIGLIDFDKLNEANTAILGSDEMTYEPGQGQVQKIPGLLSERVIPMGNDKYLKIVKKVIEELKKERPELHEFNSILTEIENEINRRFPLT